MGIYPALDIIDGAFCVMVDGVQHNLRASARMQGERMAMRVGPITIQIVQPLHILRVTVDAIHAHGSLAGLELYHGGNSSKNVSSRHSRIAPSQSMASIRWGSTAREMTLDDIITALRTSDLPPEAALRAADGIDWANRRLDRHDRRRRRRRQETRCRTAPAGSRAARYRSGAHADGRRFGQ